MEGGGISEEGGGGGKQVPQGCLQGGRGGGLNIHFSGLKRPPSKAKSGNLNLFLRILPFFPCKMQGK